MQKILSINQLVITLVPYIYDKCIITLILCLNTYLNYIFGCLVYERCTPKKIPLPFLFYNPTPSPFLSTSFSNSLLSFSLIPLLIKPSLSLYFLHNVSLTLNNHLPLLLCVYCLDCLWYDGCYYKGSFKTIISDTIAIYFWYFCRERRKNGKWKKLWFGSTWNVEFYHATCEWIYLDNYLFKFYQFYR